jgi:hypothetical protein
MFRVFNLPVTTTLTNLWTLLQTAGYIDSLGNELVTAVKNGAVVPDRVMEFDVRPSDTTTGNITYRDQQADPGTDPQLTNMSKRSNRNSICLKDYMFASSVNNLETEGIIVEIESV